MQKILEKFNPYLTCDGETEQWYFEHLQKLINDSSIRKRTFVVKPEITKNPANFAKTKITICKRKWYHIMDRETSSGSDTSGFNNILDSLREVKFKAKPILGYSNVSFELWILLHKIDMAKSVNCAKDYWRLIQKTYHLENITSFDKYKKEQNFQRVLNQIDLSDVVRAINNAEKLENRNLNTCTLKKRADFEFYEENPALSVHKVVKDILKEVGII